MLCMLLYMYVCHFHGGVWYFLTDTGILGATRFDFFLVDMVTLFHVLCNVYTSLYCFSVLRRTSLSSWPP